MQTIDPADCGAHDQRPDASSLIGEFHGFDIALIEGDIRRELMIASLLCDADQLLACSTSDGAMPHSSNKVCAPAKMAAFAS